MAARNGTSSTRFDAVRWMLDQRQLEMRVGAGIAMPGKVLAACGDAILLQHLDEDLAKPRDFLRCVSERAVANHRVLGVGVNIENGCVVERDADRLQLARERHGKPPCQLLVGAAAERHHWRPLGERGLQPRDPPALLVDTHPQRQFRCEILRLPRELSDLFGRLDVARKEDHPAEIELTRECFQILRDRVAREACDRQLTGVFPKIPNGHFRRLYRRGTSARSHVARALARGTCAPGTYAPGTWHPAPDHV